LLKNHDWGHQGYRTRPAVDQAMRANAGDEATALWERYCPWSDTNGGYIAWSKR
jgi:hypothetical protein